MDSTNIISTSSAELKKANENEEQAVSKMTKYHPKIKSAIASHRDEALKMFQADAPASRMIIVRMKNLSTMKSSTGADSSLVSALKELLSKVEEEAMLQFQIITSHRDDVLYMFKQDAPASRMVSLRLKNLSSMKSCMSLEPMTSSSALQELLLKAEEKAMDDSKKELDFKGSCEDSMLFDSNNDHVAGLDEGDNELDDTHDSEMHTGDNTQGHNLSPLHTNSPSRTVPTDVSLDSGGPKDNELCTGNSHGTEVLDKDKLVGTNKDELGNEDLNPKKAMSLHSTDCPKKCMQQTSYETHEKSKGESDSEANDSSIDTKFCFGDKVRWSREEDEELLISVDVYGNNWNGVLENSSLLKKRYASSTLVSARQSIAGRYNRKHMHEEATFEYDSGENMQSAAEESEGDISDDNGKTWSSLKDAAASGCRKCQKELDSGAKASGPHNRGCPRKPVNDGQNPRKRDNIIEPKEFNFDNRRSGRTRSAPEFFVARPSKSGVGVKEGDEEFVAKRTESGTEDFNQNAASKVNGKCNSSDTLSSNATLLEDLTALESSSSKTNEANAGNAEAIEFNLESRVLRLYQASFSNSLHGASKCVPSKSELQINTEQEGQTKPRSDVESMNEDEDDHASSEEGLPLPLSSVVLITATGLAALERNAIDTVSKILSVKSKRKQKQWSAREDKELVKQVRKHGTKWARILAQSSIIAKRYAGSSAKGSQECIRSRWRRHQFMNKKAKFDDAPMDEDSASGLQEEEENKQDSNEDVEMHRVVNIPPRVRNGCLEPVLAQLSASVNTFAAKDGVSESARSNAEMEVQPPTSASQELLVKAKEKALDEVGTEFSSRHSAADTTQLGSNNHAGAGVEDTNEQEVNQGAIAGDSITLSTQPSDADNETDSGKLPIIRPDANESILDVEAPNHTTVGKDPQICDKNDRLYLTPDVPDETGMEANHTNVQATKSDLETSILDFAGVSYNESGKCYISNLMQNRRKIYLGSYHLASEAAYAYDLAVNMIHGPNSSLYPNFATGETFVDLWHKEVKSKKFIVDFSTSVADTIANVKILIQESGQYQLWPHEQNYSHSTAAMASGFQQYTVQRPPPNNWNAPSLPATVLPFVPADQLHIYKLRGNLAPSYQNVTIYQGHYNHPYSGYPTNILHRPKTGGAIYNEAEKSKGTNQHRAFPNIPSRKRDSNQLASPPNSKKLRAAFRAFVDTKTVQNSHW